MGKKVRTGEKLEVRPEEKLRERFQRKESDDTRITNQKVKHKRYGIGTIFALKGRKVYVVFGELYRNTAFLYPKAFEDDMKLVNQELQGELMEELA